MKSEAAGIANANQALVALLLKLGLLSAEKYKENHIQSDFFPILALAHSRALNEKESIASVAKHLGLAVVEIESERVNEYAEYFDHPLLEGIELARWKNARALPIEITDEEIVLVLANPLYQELAREVSFKLGRKVRSVMASERQIMAVIGVKFGLQTEYNLNTILDETQNIAADNAQRKTRDTETSTIDLVPDSAPVVRLVNKIFSESIHFKASDIHLTPEAGNLTVRIRVDGIMHNLLEIPKYLEPHVITRIKILAGLDIAEHRRPQDGRIRLKTGDGIKDLRIAIVPTIHGENIVARILSADFGTLTFPSLGMPVSVEKMFRTAISRSCQVVLVTGPTGSGKTSTLYAGLLALRSPETHIITLEDPIEYRIEGVNQIQINEKTGLTFANSLRAVVRQDPDIIMIGEIRDAETAGIAMQTAQTGHLVLATMHTNTAASAITRLRDLGVPSYLIASSVAGVLAQRLARRLCPHCVVGVTPKERDRLSALELASNTPRSAAGCEKCNHTGYSGRIGIYSFFPVTHEATEKIREDASETELERAIVADGFSSLAEAAVALVDQGVTSITEIERVLGPLEFLFNKTLRSEKAESVNPVISGREKQNGTFSHHKKPQKPRILLVEDDENVAMVTKMLLERELFDVSVARNGQEALEQVFTNCPEIVVCDLMMPVLNGREFIKKIRVNPTTKELPILMLTSASTQENEQDLIELGADDFVAKVSSPGIITARINRLLKRTSA